MSRYTGYTVVKEAGITTVFIEELRLDLYLSYMLAWLFADLEDDAETQGVVVTGRKNVFLSGADLRELKALPDYQETIRYLEIANVGWRLIREFPKPLVMAINGYCLGGGLELALSGDLRVCVDEVRNVAGDSVPFLGLPETALGIVPPLGGVQLLTRLVGPARAKALLFTAQPITAARALEIGLVDRVVPADQLLAEARALVRAIVDNSRVAVREVKALVDQSFFTSGLEAGLVLEREAFARCCDKGDKNERINAFWAATRRDSPTKASV